MSKSILLLVLLLVGCATTTPALSTKTKCLLNPLRECTKCECCTATNDLCCCRHVDRCKCDPTAKDGKCCVAVAVKP